MHSDHYDSNFVIVLSAMNTWHGFSVLYMVNKVKLLVFPNVENRENFYIRCKDIKLKVEKLSLSKRLDPSLRALSGSLSWWAVLKGN